MTEFINMEQLGGGEVASPMSNARTEGLTEGPDMRSDFSEDIWWLLCRKSKQFARKEVRRQRWRGAKGGVLPGGYDASAIAAEAVAGLLRKISAQPHVGLNSERPTLAGLQEDLEQRVRGLVNRLHHRKETALVRSEADLAAVPTEDGEVINVVETLPASQPGPLEQLLAKEEQEEMEQQKGQFNAFLGQDQLLKDMFACLCQGIFKPASIALKLKIPCPMVKNAHKRFARKVAQFKQQRNRKKS